MERNNKDLETIMNKEVNRRKAGIIFWQESGDELHWFIVTPELYQKINEKIDSIPSNEWTHSTSFMMGKELFDLFYPNGDDSERSPDIIDKDFTQTWCREDSHFLNKYEFIGMLTIPVF